MKQTITSHRIASYQPAEMRLMVERKEGRRRNGKDLTPGVVEGLQGPLVACMTLASIKPPHTFTVFTHPSMAAVCCIQSMADIIEMRCCVAEPRLNKTQNAQKVELYLRQGWMDRLSPCYGAAET